jgi:hypothetical protein
MLVATLLCHTSYTFQPLRWNFPRSSERILVETFTGKQPLTAGAVDAMHEVLDLESYIYNLEPDSEDVERFGYEHGKACKIHKL